MSEFSDQQVAEERGKEREFSGFLMSFTFLVPMFLSLGINEMYVYPYSICILSLSFLFLSHLI